MIKEPSRWADGEISAALQRVLDSAEPVELEGAAIERLSARLQTSLAESFDARPAEQLLLSSPWWRVVAGLGALAAVGVVSWQVTSHSGVQDAVYVRLDEKPLDAQRATAVSSGTDDPRSQYIERMYAVRQPTAAPGESRSAQRGEPTYAAPQLSADASGLRLQQHPEPMNAVLRHTAAADSQRSPRSEPRTSTPRGPRFPRGAADRPAANRGEPAQAVVRRDAAPAPSAPAAAPGLAEELRGLAQIRALVEHLPERALTVADEQLQRFARGVLSPERELLRLDALVRLGRIEEARTCAAQLLAAPENHPYRARIAALLER